MFDGGVRGHLVYVLNSLMSHDASHFAHTLPLLNAIADLGVDIDLVIEKTDRAPEIAHPRIRVHALSVRSPVLRHIELVVRFWPMIRRVPTIVFCRIALPATLCALVASIGSRTKVYFWQSGTVHAYDRERPFGVAKLRHLLSVRVPFAIVCAAVDGFVTGPESMLAYYRDEVGVPRDKLRLLYNDIDIARFASLSSVRARKSARAALGIPAGTLTLLFVHRLSPVRRTMLYLPAVFDWLASSTDVEPLLLLAGAGDDFAAVRAAAEAAGVGERVRFLGSVPNSKLDGLYAAADLFLHPTYNEGFPRVLIEAMASRLPIVSTDAGGTRDVLGPLQGDYVTPRDDHTLFAERLAALAVDPETRARLADENWAQVQRFDTAAVARMYRDLLFP